MQHVPDLAKRQDFHLLHGVPVIAIAELLPRGANVLTKTETECFFQFKQFLFCTLVRSF